MSLFVSSHKKRHCLSAMSLFVSSHKKRHCLSAMSLFVSSHKKRHCLSAMSLFVSSHKKRHCLSAMSSSRVPGGTRTHDIQRSAAGRLQGKNHKQVVKFVGIPVYIGISAFPLLAFAPILRRISAELYLNIISNLETSSSLENAYPPPFLKERFSNLIAKIRKML